MAYVLGPKRTSPNSNHQHQMSLVSLGNGVCGASRSDANDLFVWSERVFVSSPPPPLDIQYSELINFGSLDVLMVMVVSEDNRGLFESPDTSEWGVHFVHSGRKKSDM